MLSELTLVASVWSVQILKHVYALTFKYMIKSELFAVICLRLKLSGFKLLAWVLQVLC